MRVLVCGGRDYGQVQIARTGAENPHAAHEVQRVHDVLGKLHADAGIDTIIEGGQRGADALAAQWSKTAHVPKETYEADWTNQGSFAGPARNQRMLDEGKPDLVIAFPGGKGTANMIGKARKAGVQVVEIVP